MPELPEVETTRRGIEGNTRGQRIKQIIVRNPNLRWKIPEQQLQNLIDCNINGVVRRGKYLLLTTNSGDIMIHLGMSGSLCMVAADHRLIKHDHVDIVLANGLALRFNDPRRFGSLLFQHKDQLHPLLQKLGPEPLSDDFNGDRLFVRSRGKSQAIKTFIMNSHTVVGVGNIYACESLFKAGIDPQKPAGKISKKRYQRLVIEIKAVLSAAIEQGGTTLKDFVGGDGKPGYFKQELAVYGRQDLPCFVCQKPIKNIRLGQRSTFYCKNCQS